jgi:hypothetical protein
MTLKSCQFCKETRLKVALDLGFMPPVNVMSRVGEDQKTLDHFPLEFGHCTSCGLVQIANEISSKIVFPEAYPYLSGMTRSLVENFQNQSKLVMEKLQLDKDDLIVDIGSNDGSLLDQYAPFARVLGVEPTAAYKVAIKKGISTLNDFFSAQLAEEILNQNGKAKIVTACNVFAHIPNLDDLLSGISKLLSEEGIFISESHYVFDLLKNLQFDTIYHEHLRYYSSSFLVEAFKKFDLEVFKIENISTHGGSIRVWAGRPNKFIIEKSVEEFLNDEKHLNLNLAIDDFSLKVYRWRNSFRGLISELVSKNLKIIGIGAPSRSSTLISYSGLNEQDVSMVAELKNSGKIGRYMPGTKIPIVEESEALKTNPDYLLLLSWHISQEIIDSLRSKGYKGGFIIPLPSPKLIESI